VNRAPILLAVLLLTHSAGAQDYYATAQGKTGSELRQALHVVIRGHTVIPYSSTSFDTSDALKVLDEDPENTNNVILIYAQRSQPKDSFAQTGGWNREHCWPNSYGLDDRHPAYSDLFNLWAEDENVNSSRGNKYYDESDPLANGYSDPAHAEALFCSTDYDSWEPPAGMKGDIARACFYMDVRYEGTSGEPDLILTENFFSISSTTNLMGKLGTLLAWHSADPVSNPERLRNERIYTLYQHNRNPFVDHPEWVDAVFRPQLRIVCIPGHVEISWEAAFSNSVLQARFTPTSAWLDVATQRFRRGNEWVIQDLTQRSVALYRLR
jgi:endonuclease I